MTPRRLGPYELLAPLGSGGAGAVFRGRHVGLGVERAVKVLASTSSSAADRFAREARALASVRNANVVGVHESGVEPDGARWLAMELVAGDPLDQVLSRGPLPLDRALEVLAQVARGVEALHAVGIIHRDIKPANVLLARDGRAVVVDLGLALAPDSDERLTRTGAWVGTALYASPEQLSGAPLSPRTDVHALGLLAYEVTTGRAAFAGERSDEVLSRIFSTSRPVPSELDPRLPAALDDLVRRASAYEPAERFARGGEVAAALEALRAAPGPSAGAARRRRRLLGVGAGLALAAIALVVRASAPRGAAPVGPPAPGPSTSRGPEPSERPSPPGHTTTSARRGRSTSSDAPFEVLAATRAGRTHVAWTDDGRLVTLSSRDSHLQVWTISDDGGVPAKAREPAPIRLPPRGFGLAAGPSGTALALVGQTEAGLPAPLMSVDATSRVVAPFGRDVLGLCLTRATDGAVAVATPSQVELLTPEGRQLERFTALDAGPLEFHAVAASSRLVAAASGREAAHLGDVASILVVWPRSGSSRAPLRTPSATRIGPLAISPRDADVLFIGWVSGAVTAVHPLEPSREPVHLVAPGSTVSGVALLPSAHGVRVRALAFSPDGLRLATAAGDDQPGDHSELRWWRLPASGDDPPTPSGPLVRLARIPCGLAFSPDGRWLAISSSDGAVELRASPE